MIRENNKQLLKRLTDDIMCVTKMELEKYPSMFRITLFIGLDGTRYYINRDLFDFLKPLFFFHKTGTIRPDTTIEELLKDRDKMTLYIISDIVTKYQTGTEAYKKAFKEDPKFHHWVMLCRSAQDRLSELIREDRVGMSPLGPGFMYLNYIKNIEAFEQEDIDEKD